MNIVILSGRLTRDPEVKTLGSGSKVTSFSLAVDRADKARSTDFFRCEAWGHTGDFVAKYFKKGSPIEVQGSIRTDKYEKDGQTRELTKIVVNSAGFVVKSNSASDTQERNTSASDDDDGGFEF